jgi:hypothetical protein
MTGRIVAPLVLSHLVLMTAANDRACSRAERALVRPLDVAALLVAITSRSSVAEYGQFQAMRSERCTQLRDALQEQDGLRPLEARF